MLTSANFSFPIHKKGRSFAVGLPISFLLVLGTLLLFLFPVSTSGQNVHADYYDGTIYLKIKEKSGIELPEIDANTDLRTYPYFSEILTDFEVYQLERPFRRIPASIFKNTYQLQFHQNDRVEELIRKLADHPKVEYAEKVPIMQSYYTPNDPYANNSNQWFLSKIKAYAAWDIHQNGSDVVLAIVDDAVRWDHEDLEANLWINQAEYNGYPNYDDDGNGYVDDVIGWDAADNDNNPMPPSYAGNSEFSHGTHCAGIAAGVTNNNEGVASISFNNARIMACKGKYDYGSGGLQKIWQAFEYAAVNEAEIISCSWGGGGYSTTNQNLINWAVNNGSIVVAAAGNDNTSVVHYPAGYNNVIAVANTTQSDTRNSSSNYGAWIDISAPGTSILSPIATTASSYTQFNGTSMACPLVAGLLAQMKSFKPSASNSELISCLFSSADNIDAQNSGFVGKLGAGRINAEAALECLDDGGGGGGDCDDNAVTLIITLDNYGSETTWGIYEGNTLVASGGPYPDFSEGLVVTEEICLENGCYELVFFDEFGDGMCCDFGEGSYELVDEDNNLLATGGEFQQEDVSPFCVNGSGGGQGCAAPGGLNAFDVGYCYVRLSWNSESGADKYQTRYRKVGTSSWNEGNWYSNTGVSWGNMSPCTQYEFQVRSQCNGAAGSFSSSILVNTGGCGDDYCYSYGLTWDDWIQRVRFNHIDHTSGKNYGYANFTDVSTQIAPGETHIIRLTAGTDDNSETVYWRVWIDFNQDGDFSDSGEQVFQGTSSNSNTLVGGVLIPASVQTGITRMRVSMDLNGYPDPCAVNSYREVEDYTLNIGVEETLTLSPENMTIGANATSASFSVNANTGWNITSISGGWVSFSETGSGVSLTFDPNSASTERTAKITLKTSSGNVTKTFTLIQEGTEPNAIGEEQKESFSVLVFPNPASDVVKILLEPEGSSSVTVLLTDSQGKTLGVLPNLSVQKGDPVEWNVSHLPAGLYFVQIQMGEQVAVKRVAIVR